MPRIHALDEQVIRQIAAGEVVERPASVVKELLENSIDASSRKIVLEISASGKELIRVADDGCGMTAADAVLALERHTTSKIQSAQDLESLGTFGFRGEALPSISSISNMELTTRCADESNGYSIMMEGGKIISKKECGRAVGTTIDVKNLFFNTPARLKFLKSDSTERSKIIRTFEETAIAHPEIHFTLKGTSAKPLELPARNNFSDDVKIPLNPPLQKGENVMESAVSSPFVKGENAMKPGLSSPFVKGDRGGFCQGVDVLMRLSDLWGDSFSAENLFPLSLQHPYIRIEGWVSKPSFHQASKNFQIFYVNRRPIQSRSLTHALYEAFKDCLPVGRHPAAVIFVQLDPSQVDVNVHPSKREVRFRNESQIYEALFREIRLKRTQLSEAPKVFGEVETVVEGEQKNFPPFVKGGEGGFFRRLPLTATTTPLDSGSRPPISRGGLVRNDKQESSNDKQIEPLEPFEQIKQLHQELSSYSPAPAIPRVLAQFDALYILAQRDSQLVIIDQHAAGERILYEKFKNALTAQSTVPVQTLLFPIVWNVTAAQAELLKNVLDTFQKIGFMLEPFGEKTFRLTEAPAMIAESELKNTLEQILSAVEGQNQPALVTETILKQTACRAAVKANDVLSNKELAELLVQLAECDNPHTCPHGRPVTITLSRQELDKKFGRT